MVFPLAKPLTGFKELLYWLSNLEPSGKKIAFVSICFCTGARRSVRRGDKISLTIESRPEICARKVLDKTINLITIFCG